MALPRWQSTFTDDAGNVRASLSVEVRDESSGALAALYSDRAGTSPKSNPATTDADGYLFFYVAPGRYRIQATDVDWRDVEITQQADIAQKADLAGGADANFTTTPQVSGEGVLVENTSGVVIQQAFTSTGAVVTSTTAIPYDDTIPQDTEGTEALSLNFTPKRSDSRIRLVSTLQMRGGVSNKIRTAAIFVSSQSGALAAASAHGDSSAPAPGADSISIVADIASSSTTARTFSARFGANDTNTVYLNADSGGTRIFGGVSASTLEITEYMP